MVIKISSPKETSPQSHSSPSINSQGISPPLKRRRNEQNTQKDDIPIREVPQPKPSHQFPTEASFQLDPIRVEDEDMLICLERYEAEMDKWGDDEDFFKNVSIDNLTESLAPTTTEPFPESISIIPKVSIAH